MCQEPSTSTNSSDRKRPATHRRRPPPGSKRPRTIFYLDDVIIAAPPEFGYNTVRKPEPFVREAPVVDDAADVTHEASIAEPPTGQVSVTESDRSHLDASLSSEYYSSDEEEDDDDEDDFSEDEAFIERTYGKNNIFAHTIPDDNDGDDSSCDENLVNYYSRDNHKTSSANSNQEEEEEDDDWACRKPSWWNALEEPDEDIVAKTIQRLGRVLPGAAIQAASC